MSKHCDHCHTEMSRPQKVSYAQWERQRFCSKRCANLAGACRGAAKHAVLHHPRAYSFHSALAALIGGRPQ